MRVVKHCLALLTAVLLCGSVHAQECPGDPRMNADDFLKRALLEAREHAADRPPTVPSAIQTSAPSSAAVSPDILSGADFSSLLALAVDSGFAAETNGAVTLDLNLFSFVTAFDRSVIEEQAKYQQFTNTRRFAGALTFGGKGDSFDQDGDGDIDEARSAQSHADIVTWELRYRIFGSHDRRDKENYERVFKALSDNVTAQDHAFIRLNTLYTALHREQAIEGYCPQDVEEFLRTPEARTLIRLIGSADVGMGTVYEDVLKQIDASPLVTVIFGGTERKDVFGADNMQLGIRASRGWSDGNVAANLDYAQTDEFNAAPERKTTKFALGYSRKLLRGYAGHQQSGIDFSVALAWEKYRNVVGVEHDEVAKANVKFAYPISPGVDLPISFTWANHADLLSDEEEIRGHIGFTFDMRKLFQTKD